MQSTISALLRRTDLHSARSVVVYRRQASELPLLGLTFWSEGRCDMAPGSHSATHHKLETIRRSQGRSAVQIGAYITRARSYDDRTGLWHDFRSKGGIEGSERVGWPGDGQSLWNAAEAVETRRNAVTARHTVLALPAELPVVRRAALMRGYSLWLRDRYGVAIEWALHAPGPEGDPRNHHGHLVETTRRVDDKGQFSEKARELDDRSRRADPRGGAGRSRGSLEMEARRAEWAKRCNAELEKTGVAARVDHRSLKRRAGTLDEPGMAARPRHMGKVLTAKKRRYEQAVQIAAQAGARPPEMPSFLVAALRQKKSLAKARVAWNGLLQQVSDWLDDGSPEIDRDDAADILGAVSRAGHSTVRHLVKPKPTNHRVHQKAWAEMVRIMTIRQARKQRKRTRIR